MKYKAMLVIAFVMALFSSGLTAFGMMDLFANIGTFILVLFFIIDLGRFLLFNFVVDEWHNLRKVKYVIVIILSLLFVYSAAGIYSKLDSLVSQQTREAMINIAAYNKELANAELKQDQSLDYLDIARKEYDNALNWNKLDYENCLKRANKDLNRENNCNNTKRRLDKTALANFEKSKTEGVGVTENTEEKIKQLSKNKSEIANVLVTICKMTQKDCNTYDSLQNALTILIFLVIIGTDYLQIAIVLAINTRKNKEIKIYRKKPIININEVEIENVKDITSIKEGLVQFSNNIENIDKKIIEKPKIKEEIKKEIKKEIKPNINIKKENKLNPFKEKIILPKLKIKKEVKKPVKQRVIFGPKPK